MGGREQQRTGERLIDCECDRERAGKGGLFFSKTQCPCPPLPGSAAFFCMSCWTAVLFKLPKRRRGWCAGEPKRWESYLSRLEQRDGEWNDEGVHHVCVGFVVICVGVIPAVEGELLLNVLLAHGTAVLSPICVL